MRRERLLEIAAVAAGAIAVALVGGHVVLAHFGDEGLANDWDQHLHWYWVARTSLLQYHQFPQWNPWECGGMPLLGNPQSHVWTPLVLVQLALGVVRGIQAEILIHLALAASGGYVLGRQLSLGYVGAAAVGLFFSGSSWFAAHVGEGHGWSLTYGYVPWAVAAMLHSFHQRRLVWAAVAGAILATMIGEGGIYPAPHAVLLIGLLALFALGRKNLQPLLAIATCGVSAVLLAAPKLWPTLDLMRKNPRLVDSHEITGLKMLWIALFSLDQDRNRLVPHDRWYWGFHEYSAYLGPAVAILLVLGAVLAFKRARSWIVGAVLFLLLGCGDFTDGLWSAHPHALLNPWALLHEVPLFASQHVPSRFLVTFVLCAAVLAGFGADELVRRFGSGGRAVAVALVAVGAAFQLWVGPPNLRHMFEGAPVAFPVQSAFRQYFHPSDRVMLPLAQANLGALHCYDFAALRPHVVASNWPGYRGEAWLDGPGTAQITRWSPNELELEVDPGHAEDLVINQNFDEPWHVQAGTGEVHDRQGLVAVSLPAGSQHLVLRYANPHFTAGLALFALGVLGIIGLALFERRRAPAAASVSH